LCRLRTTRITFTESWHALLAAWLKAQGRPVTVDELNRAAARECLPASATRGIDGLNLHVLNATSNAWRAGFGRHAGALRRFGGRRSGQGRRGNDSGKRTECDRGLLDAETLGARGNTRPTGRLVRSVSRCPLQGLDPHRAAQHS
jgi:hypothetical protein